MEQRRGCERWRVRFATGGLCPYAMLLGYRLIKLSLSQRSAVKVSYRALTLGVPDEPLE